MVDSYSFDKFCELLSDEDILRTSTAFGVAKKFQNYILDIRSQVLKELMNRTENKDVYLEFLINEIEKQDYVKEAGVNYINKWLKEYNITIDAILEYEDYRAPIFAVLDRHYNDMEAFSEEKDKALLVQTDFLNYFCCMYANELIEFLKSKMPKAKPQEPEQIPIVNNKPFKDEYLNVFCKEINTDDRAIKSTSFMQLYDYGITHYRPYLESEITENLLLLDKDKKEDYLNYVKDKVSKTIFADIPEDFINKWISKYKVDIEEFPKFSNKELDELLSMSYSGYYQEPKTQDFILDIQIDFYCYACMLEVKKVTEFIESKSEKSNININPMKEEISESISRLKWLGKSSQLGFIISSLVDLGYIEAPLRQNGDINYTQFAKLVKQTFDIDTTESTLSKYLNQDSEKGQEPMRKFNENGFNIPHKSIVS